MKNVMSILNEELVSVMNQTVLSKYEPTFIENDKGGMIEMYDYEREHPYWIWVEEENDEIVLNLQGDSVKPFKFWECDKLTQTEMLNVIYNIKGEWDKLMDDIDSPTPLDEEYFDNLIMNWRY